MYMLLGKGLAVCLNACTCHPGARGVCDKAAGEALMVRHHASPAYQTRQLRFTLLETWWLMYNLIVSCGHYLGQEGASSAPACACRPGKYSTLLQAAQQY